MLKLKQEVSVLTAQAERNQEQVPHWFNHNLCTDLILQLTVTVHVLHVVTSCYMYTTCGHIMLHVYHMWSHHATCILHVYYIMLHVYYMWSHHAVQRRLEAAEQEQERLSLQHQLQTRLTVEQK